MECVICGKVFPGTSDFHYCDMCGVELVDDERERELSRRLAEATTARESLDREKALGRVGDSAYRTTVRALSSGIAETETALAGIERERKRLRNRWVSWKLARAKELIGAGRLDDAYASVQNILQVEPANPSSHMVMARISQLRGNFEDAIRAATYARGLDPSDGTIEDYISRLRLEASFKERRDAPEEGERRATGPAVTAQRETGGETAGIRGGKAGRSRPPVKPWTQRKKPDLTGWIEGLVNTGFLKWWYFVGTFILLAGLVGLVTWQWGTIGKYFVFFTVLASNVGLYLLGHYLAKRVRLGSSIIMVIASLLVPLNIYLFNYYAISGTVFNPNMLGIAGSIIAAAVYGLNFYRSRDQALLAFTAMTPLSLLYFVLQSSGVSVHFYGLWFVGMAVCYFASGYMLRRGGLSSYARTMYAVANATIVLALLTTLLDFSYFMDEGFRTSGLLIGSAAAALLIGSFTYEDKVLAYISSGMILVSTYFLAHTPGANWYMAAPGLTLAAGALLLIGYVDSVLIGEHDSRPFTNAGVAAMLGILATLAMKDLLWKLPQVWETATTAEMWASFISGLVIALLLWAEALLEKKRYLGYVASSAVVYASLIFLGFRVDGPPLWCLVEATLVAGSLLLLGLVLERTSGREWALTAYVPAFTVAGVSTAAASVFYLPVISKDIIPGLTLYGHAYLSLGVTALATTIYLLVAALRSRRPHWLYAACATATIAFAVQAHGASAWNWVTELSGGGVNYGMLFVPLAVLFAVAGHLLERAGYDDLSLPLFIAFFGVSALSFASQFYYLSLGATAAVAITFGAFLAVFAAETALWNRGEFLYPAILSAFMSGTVVIDMVLPGKGLEVNNPLFLIPIAALLLIGGTVLAMSRERDEFAIPMLVSGAVFMVAGLICQAAFVVWGLGYSVYLYLFAVSAICAVSAGLAGRYQAEGWKELLPELLAYTSLGHLALAIGYVSYAYSGGLTVAAVSLAGLGSALAAGSALADRLPEWLERPMQYGAPVIGFTAVACSLINPVWGGYYANVICVAVLALSFITFDLQSWDRLYYRIALGVYAAISACSFMCFAGATRLPVPDGALAWQCGSLAVMAVLAFVGSEYFEDVVQGAAGYIFAVLAWLGLGALLNVSSTYMAYWLVAPAVVISVTSFIHYTRNHDRFAAVGWVFGIPLFVASIAQPVALGLHFQAIVSMSAALAVGAASVFVYGEEQLAYLPLTMSVVETVYILAVIRPPV
ncbi:MAG: hypothetical protein KJ625_08690, partial [Actinobacteria bacterium]|nr:hypothetical protein [Actinomycetota bacterium]